MSDEDSLGDRMKRYESVPQISLTRRVPVIIRLDGKAFHTFTHGMKKPFDRDLQEAMWGATAALCKQVQGVKVAYVQSDEVSLLLTDYESTKTQGWFDYDLEKVVSVSASIMSVAFNHLCETGPAHLNERRNKVLAVFDARAFNIPREEVANYFVWRQQDATRNSIEAAAQVCFSHKSLHGLNCNQLQEKLFQDKSINWNDYPVVQKRGACIVKQSFEGLAPPAPAFSDSPSIPFIRKKWVVDENIPVFTQDRNYIEKFVYVPQEVD